MPHHGEAFSANREADSANKCERRRMPPTASLIKDGEQIRFVVNCVHDGHRLRAAAVPASQEDQRLNSAGRSETGHQEVDDGIWLVSFMYYDPG